MPKPLSSEDLALGNGRWKDLRAMIQTLCERHDADHTIRDMLLGQAKDGQEKDPAGLGVDMLRDSAHQLLTPMEG